MLDCKISSSIAWQDVSKYDLLYVLTLDNGKFFYDKKKSIIGASIGLKN